MLVLDNGDKIRGDASTAAEVDYTIHGMTGTTLSQLADGQLADSTTDMYTATAIVVVKAITLVNTGAAARTINLFLLPSGGTARRIFADDFSLGIGYSLHYDGVKTTILNPSGGPAVTYADHAASHVDGNDDIQDATAAQKGLATAAQITKLDAIAAGAVADHGALTGLDHDDHTQYVLATGARAMGELTLTPKPSSISTVEGTIFYCSDDNHVYVGTE